MRYWSTPAWIEGVEALRMIERDRASVAEGSSIRFGIADRAMPEVIGTCTLYNIQRGNRRADIGYALRREHCGRGLMHEALTALLAHGFDALILNRVEADIDPRNQASARTLERLGFVREGTLRERWIVNGEVSDTALYGLLKSDWDARDRPS